MWSSFVTCITMGYLFHVWGGVGVGLFVISICTELLCFERGKNLQLINCWPETHPDWLATEETAAVACLTSAAGNLRSVSSSGQSA